MGNRTEPRPRVKEEGVEGREKERSCCWRGVEGKWFVVRCLLHNFAVLQTVFWFSISKKGVQILKTEYEFYLSPS